MNELQTEPRKPAIRCCAKPESSHHLAASAQAQFGLEDKQALQALPKEQLTGSKRKDDASRFSAFAQSGAI